LCREKYCL